MPDINDLMAGWAAPGATPGEAPAPKAGGDINSLMAGWARPEGELPDTTPEEYARRAQTAGANVGRSTQEHAEILKKRGFSKEAVKSLGQQYEVAAATQREGEKEFGYRNTGTQFLRTGLGFADLFGAQGNQKYGEAVQRFRSGNLQPGDAERIAEYENRAKIEQGGTLLGSKDAADIAKGLLGLPKIIQETMAGGALLKAGGVGMAAGAEATVGRKLLTDAGRTAALLPVTPSMWWAESQQKNLENNRQANDIRGFGPGLIHGYANLFVLGRLQNGILGSGLGTAAKKGGAGVLEQGLVDSATNFADTVTSQLDAGFGKGFKISTGYGTFEHLVSGEGGEALKAATGQFLMFAAFAGLHRSAKADDAKGAEEHVHDLFDAAGKDLEKLKKSGYTPEAAARHLTDLQARLQAKIDGGAKSVKNELIVGGKSKLAEAVDKGLAAEPKSEVPAADGLPPVPKGHTRFYHGGTPGEGPRWLTPDWAYAEGYARKSGSEVQYVDVPEGHKSLMKAFDDTGSDVKSPYSSFEAPADIASRLKTIKAKPVEAAPEPPKSPDVDAPAPGWMTDNRKTYIDAAARAGLTDEIAALAKGGKTAKEIAVVVGKRLSDAGIPESDHAPAVRAIRDSLGITPAGPVGFMGVNVPHKAPKTEAPPESVKPVEEVRSVEEVKPAEAPRIAPEARSPDTAPEPPKTEIVEPAKPAVGKSYEEVVHRDPGESPTAYAERLIREKDEFLKASVNQADLRLAGVSQKEATRILEQLVREGKAERRGSFYGPAVKPPEAAPAKKPAPGKKPSGSVADTVAELTALYERGLKDQLDPGLRPEAVHTLLRQVRDRHTPEEVRDIAGALTGKRGRNAEAALKIIHDDVTGPRRNLYKWSAEGSGNPKVDAEFKQYSRPEFDPKLLEGPAATAAAKPPPRPAEEKITPQQAREQVANMDAADWRQMPKGMQNLLRDALKRGGYEPVEKLLGAMAEKRATKGDEVVLDAEIERRIDEAKIPAKYKAAVKEHLQGAGLRPAAEKAGVSYETIRKAGEKIFGESGFKVVEEQAAGRGRAMAERLESQMGGEEAVRKMRRSERPTASEGAAVEMLQGKIAGNAPGEKVSFGAMGAKPGEAAPEPPGLAAHLKESAARWVNTVKDWFGRLAGQTAPKTSRLSEASGDSIARVAAAKQYASALAPHVLDKILPHDPDNPSQSGGWARDVVGGVLVEDSLRHARQTHLAEAKAARDALPALEARLKVETDKGKAASLRPEVRKEINAIRAEIRKATEAAEKSEAAAKKVGTVIGSHRTAEDWEANPFKTEADFTELSRLPWVREAIDRYEKEYVPLKEEHFRRSQGMDPEAEIDSRTQIPGRPVFRLHLPEGEARFNGGGGTGRGNLTAQRAGKLAQSKEASGSGYYEIDLGKILEGDLTRLVPNSAKAEMYRRMAADKLGVWAKPGAEAPGEGWRKIPDVRPPKGTQEADKGQTDFWVHPDAYQETRQVLGVDEPASRLPLAGALAKATLASSVEAAYHTRNLLTLLTRPGMNPLHFMKKVRDVIARDPETMRRIVELTETGAMKQHGFESDTLEPGYKGGMLNPLNVVGKAMEWSSKAMTVVDRAMRLTADHAFDVLARRPGVDGSEAARRDFINQLGNYNKLTQHKFVAWLRDTGLGPFATAGSNFWMQGMRSLTLTHGVKTTSAKADALLRGEMLLRMATLPTIAALVNYLAWGRFDGDDETPIAGLKLGRENGKTSYLDLGGLVGVTRGMRETGLLAMAEGQREGAKKAGAKSGDWIDRGLEDIATSALHPAVGPPVAFLHTALTGENTLGGHVAPKADLKKGESQGLLNAYAALFSVNPVLEAWLKPAVSEAAGLKEKKEAPAAEKLFKMLGPFGVKTRGDAPGSPYRKRLVPDLTPQQKAKKPTTAPPR